MFRRRPSKVAYSLVLWVLLLAVIGSTPGFGAAASAAAPLPQEPVGAGSGGLVAMDATAVLRPPALPDGMLSAQPAAVRMSEGFESNWPASGWQLADNSSGDGGEYLFGKRTCHPHTGSSAGWAVGGGAQGGALGCTGNYPNNAYTWAVYGPVDLSTATAASLTFYVWGRTQASQGNTCLDYLFAGSSTDKTNFTGGRWCGNATGGDAGNGYYKLSVDLAGRLGASRVWIAFAFLSDGSTTDVGFTIDDAALDVAGAGPAPAGRAVYLPLITKPPKDEAPPAGTAFEWLQRALNTPGAQENFVLDTTRCTFSSARGFLYYSGVTQPYTAAEVQRKTLANMQAMIFRAKTDALLGDYRSLYVVTPAQITYPDANRLRLHLEPASTGPNTLNFTGDVVQNEMQIDYSETISMFVYHVLGSERLIAQFSCPISWVPPSRWTPMPVANVQASDNNLYDPSNRCFHVTWQPVANDAPAAKADKYKLTLVNEQPLGTVQVPGTLSQFDDCSAAAQAVTMWNALAGIYYEITALSASGLESKVAISNRVAVVRTK